MDVVNKNNFNRRKVIKKLAYTIPIIILLPLKANIERDRSNPACRGRNPPWWCNDFTS